MNTVVKLTPEQKALVRGVPGLAERAARDVAKRFGQFRPMDEMVRSAHYGIAKAAQSFEHEMGTFEEWAYWKAVWSVLDDARSDRRQTAVILAARVATFEFLRFCHRPPRDDDANNTEEQDRSELDGFEGGLVAAMLRGVALMPAATGGEDEMIARLDAARAATRFKSVLDELTPDQIALLNCKDEADLKELAPSWGRSWWTLARARAKLMQVVGARLLGKRLDAMPAWDDEVWRAIGGARLVASTHAVAPTP
jgi:hypothetical protein